MITASVSAKSAGAFCPRREFKRFVYLLPGLTAGILTRSGGSLSAGNVSTFISIKLTNGQPKIRFGCAASINNHADCRNDALVPVHDIDCLLHASSPGDDVFDDHECFVGENLKA